MRGQWNATISTGEKVTLTLGKNSYTVVIAGLGGRSGRISVVKDEIVFSQGEDCQGSGTYNWSIEGEELTFAIQGVDECGRAVVLDGVTYTLLLPSP